MHAEDPRVSPPATVDPDRQRHRLDPQRISPLPLLSQPEPAPKIRAPGLAHEVRRRAWVPYFIWLSGSAIGTLGFQIADGVFPGIPRQPFLLIQLATLIALPVGTVLIHVYVRRLARRWPLPDVRETLEALRQDSDKRVKGVATRALRSLPKDSSEVVPTGAPEGSRRELTPSDSR